MAILSGQHLTDKLGFERKDFVKILLEKGERQLFLCLKEKGCKKKQTSLLLDLLSTVYRKARSLYAKAYPRVHFSLDERNFAARRFFEELGSHGGFSFGRQTGFLLPQKQILSPRSIAK